MALTLHPPSTTTAGIGPVIRRLIRYGSVSAIATGTTLVLLGLLVLLGWPAVLANVVATAVGTVPSFELNRRWVWDRGRRQSRSFRRQILPYCLLSLAGLVLSTLAVHIAADATIGSGRLLHTVAVETANIGTYGALWLIQFFVCDRILFAAPSESPRVSSHPDDRYPSGRPDGVTAPALPPRRNARPTSSPNELSALSAGTQCGRSEPTVPRR
jgi:putative flippase GtrA